MDWDQRELKAKEVAEFIGCSDSTIYRFFREHDSGELPEDMREIREFVVQKTSSDDAERYTSHNVEYLYNVKEVRDDEVLTFEGDDQMDDETDADEGSEQVSEVVDVEPEGAIDGDLSDLRSKWRQVQSLIGDSKEKLEYVQEQLQDEDTLLDGDLWELVNEERQDAVDQLESVKPEVVEVAFEGYENIRVLSDHEISIINQLREGNLSVVETEGEGSDDGESDDEEEDSEGGRNKDWLLGREDLEELNSTDATGKESRALVYGGEPRHQRISKLEDELGFDKVDWPSSQKGNEIQTAATRISNGHYDAVFILTSFASHSHEDKLKRACCQLDVHFIKVPNGQSVSRLKRAYAENVRDRAS